MANRILLVSAEGHADAVVPLLEKRGMSVTVVRDLASAVSRLAEHQLIVLDAPDAPRLALLCRQINDATGSRHAPMLAIAHSRDVEARVRLLGAGAADVLAQPIDERELEALVEALLLRSPTAAAPVATARRHDRRAARRRGLDE